MTEKILIWIHRTEIKKGVASVLSWFEGRGSEKFSGGSAPGPPLGISSKWPLQTTMLDPPLHTVAVLGTARPGAEKICRAPTPDKIFGPNIFLRFVTCA